MSDKAVRYQFVLELYKKDDEHEHLGTFTVTPDWEPALEWARFRTMCSNPSPPYVLGGGGAIEPRWHARAGPPYLEGVKAVIPHDGLPPAGFDIPLHYFADAARAASSAVVENGKLAPGELFAYLVCAYECRDLPAAHDPEMTPAFHIKPVELALDVNDLDMGDLLAQSSPYGPPDDEEMPVFMPRQTVHEAVELMVRAGNKETGGILIGHLRRDPSRRNLFLEVTAQIAVEHAQQELTRLTFTPDTWTAVDAALALRGKGEIRLGWWHSHPASHWCEECPPERRLRCEAAGAPSGDFFSAHDVALHRSVFPRAYSIALVISDGCGNAGVPSWRLFGWRYGMIMARGFRILEHPWPPAAAAVQLQGDKHVPN